MSELDVADQPVIELLRIARSFPGSPPIGVLADVSLRVKAGEYLAILGPSGSGKSTLLNLIGLLDQPTEGSYWFEGFLTSELTEIMRTALRGRRIGFVFQDFRLLPTRSALENVALGQLYTGVPITTRTQTAKDMLVRVGLGNLTDALPATMSGGERQRVAIARALSGGPSLLLCDEPTGNLDSHTAAQILDLFDELNRDGVTIIIITHDSTTASRARRVTTIRDGTLSDGEVRQ